MIEITKEITAEITVLYPMLVEIIGEDKFSGLTYNEVAMIAYLDDTATALEQSITQDMLDNYGDLTVSANKATMDEGDADPIITCSESGISGDTNVGYVVILDGEVYASGSMIVAAGVTTLNLISPVDGIYEIFMYRTTGNYASGSVTITVSEV